MAKVEIIYRFATKADAAYYGKLSEKNPLNNHLGRLWKKFIKALGIKDSSLANVPELEGSDDDTAALDQLEDGWLTYVLEHGFHPDDNNAYVTSVRTKTADSLYQWAYDNLGTTVVNGKETKISSCIQLAWGCDRLAYIEALVIMWAVYYEPLGQIHNTQIDFFSDRGSRLTQAKIQGMITPKAFGAQLEKTSVKRQQAVATYQVFNQVQNQLDKDILKIIFSNKKVQERVAISIEDIAESLTSYTKLDRSIKQGNNKTKNKEQKEKRIKLMEQIKQVADKSQSDVFTEHDDLAKTLSNALTTWLSKDNSPGEWTHLNDDYKSYKDSVANRLAKLFQKEFEAIKGTYGSKSKQLKNGAFHNWTYVQKNWSKFYKEQMSIHYGNQFGALVQIPQIEQKEFTEYEFGRERLLDKNNNIRVLFTSSKPEMKDDVKSNLQMTIY